MTSLPARVAVLFGGPSPEHDVSILTGLQAARALRDADVEQLHILYWTKSGEWAELPAGLEARAFLDGTPDGSQRLQLTAGPGGGFSVQRRGRLGTRSERLELDAALNCCHGGPGEDGTLQGVLDLSGIRYSGPSASGAALGMDKLAFGAVASSAGLPSLDRALLEADGVPPGFSGPYIVKPRFGGSSIGIEVVEDVKTARALARSSVHLRRGAVIEPYRPDLYDLQVAVRTWPAVELSAIERPIRGSKGSEILGYADKYRGGDGMASAPRELPARIGDKLAEAIREAAHSVARLAGLRGVARVDFLSDGSSLYLNEVNTIPGSLARYLFVEPELPFVELLACLLAEARARPGVSHGAAGADGLVLRDAGSIAAKLA